MQRTPNYSTPTCCVWSGVVLSKEGFTNRGHNKGVPSPSAGPRAPGRPLRTKPPKRRGRQAPDTRQAGEKVPGAPFGTRDLAFHKATDAQKESGRPLCDLAPRIASSLTLALSLFPTILGAGPKGKPSKHFLSASMILCKRVPTLTPT